MYILNIYGGGFPSPELKWDPIFGLFRDFTTWKTLEKRWEVQISGLVQTFVEAKNEAFQFT